MKNKDLIAFPKEDNWNKFDYNFRIFDALASLLHFKSACSGIFKGKDDVLHLSYNTQVIEADTLTKKQVELVNLVFTKVQKSKY
ncbi:hypothetical protein [Rickettsia endosymbiont of Polydrusus tereticollis]|uniref:hypothetical protein n=1 Tax=Rickettsia endosymbiont of Polydrusus tereticollis TaxID=3066251 RepID=UPI003133324F